MKQKFWSWLDRLLHSLKEPFEKSPQTEQKIWTCETANYFLSYVAKIELATFASPVFEHGLFDSKNVWFIWKWNHDERNSTGIRTRIWQARRHTTKKPSFSLLLSQQRLEIASARLSLFQNKQRRNAYLPNSIRMIVTAPNGRLMVGKKRLTCCAKHEQNAIFPLDSALETTPPSNVHCCWFEFQTNCAKSKWNPCCLRGTATVVES